MTEEVVQFVVLILIGTGYAVVTVLKKVNKWINEQRMRQPSREQPPPSRPERPSERPVREKTEEPPPPRQDPKTILLRELAKALTGELTVEESPPVPPQPWQTAEPMPAMQAPPIRRPKPRKKTVFQALPIEAPLPVPVPETRTSSEKIKPLPRPRMGHLAVLRSRDDLRRAVLAHEILGPPRALRPFHPMKAKTHRQ